MFAYVYENLRTKYLFFIICNTNHTHTSTYRYKISDHSIRKPGWPEEVFDLNGGSTWDRNFKNWGYCHLPKTHFNNTGMIQPIILSEMIGMDSTTIKPHEKTPANLLRRLLVVFKE